jgi:hypothetical protein
LFDAVSAFKFSGLNIVVNVAIPKIEIIIAAIIAK